MEHSTATALAKDALKTTTRGTCIPARIWRPRHGPANHRWTHYIPGHWIVKTEARKVNARSTQESAVCECLPLLAAATGCRLCAAPARAFFFVRSHLRQGAQSGLLSFSLRFRDLSDRYVASSCRCRSSRDITGSLTHFPCCATTGSRKLVHDAHIPSGAH